MTGVRRVVLLTLGWEELPKSVSVYGAPEEERLREPVPGVLLDVDGGWLLLDTGFNTALIGMPGCAAATIPGPATPRSSPGPGSRSRRRSIGSGSRSTGSAPWR